MVKGMEHLARTGRKMPSAWIYRMFDEGEGREEEEEEEKEEEERKSERMKRETDRLPRWGGRRGGDDALALHR